MEDTICAVATPVGIGGISIIRVSGESSIEIVNKIFKGKDLSKVASHTISYGFIVDNEEKIDEVLVSVMRSPKTYTTENTVEINTHGGTSTVNKVIEILIENGVRLAEPGEFTKRAFLNGRIDLLEAKAVSDLIMAKTENARKISMNSLTGTLTDLLNKIKQDILEIEAKIEVNIDYPEYDDIENMTKTNILPVLKSISQKFNKIITESKNSKIITNGINIALIGKPNVGKSSLLNALLEENKAIVTNIEGTTRDSVEGQIVLNGFLINFIDTAGIRKTTDIVEKIGTKKSLEIAENADLIILVLNGNERLTQEDTFILSKIKNKKHIVFINKDDLESKNDYKGKHITGNTVNKNGLNDLKSEILHIFSLDSISEKDYTYMTNASDVANIKLAKKSIDNAINTLEDGLDPDLVLIDLKETREKIGLILGDNISEDLINEMFSKFCLGK